jgi:hypothetical protein
MTNRAAVPALIAVFLLVAFVIIVVSGASGVVKVLAGVVLLAVSLGLLVRAGTLMKG